MEAQKAQVIAFVGKGRIVRDFVEVESVKRNDRPQLSEAVAFARKQKALLVIAKLDRLSRNASFIFTLRNSAVNFVLRHA